MFSMVHVDVVSDSSRTTVRALTISPPLHPMCPICPSPTPPHPDAPASLARSPHRSDKHRDLLNQVEVWGGAAKATPRIFCGIYTHKANHYTKVKVCLFLCTKLSLFWRVHVWRTVTCSMPCKYFAGNKTYHGTIYYRSMISVTKVHYLLL